MRIRYMSRPHHSSRLTQAEVIEKIVWLRKHYHFGPAKIAMSLARYHDPTISTSGVWRILRRLGMNRLPASQRYRRHNLRWKRYEKQRPGHQLQVDVKFTEPLGQTGRRKKYYQFTAIDDCTRLRVLRAYPGCDPEDRYRVHRRRHGQAAVRCRARANRQRAVFTGKQRDEGRVALEVQLGLRGIRPLHSRTSSDRIIR
jgi:hypothetical protein